ncbi:hypothetical protein BDZ97DRAFT_1757553 [Flammula alnicola]|nr:hypothetical protein BDZ97DRAFT_1757553 [Flammula alnicola]
MDGFNVSQMKHDSGTDKNHEPVNIPSVSAFGVEHCSSGNLRRTLEGAGLELGDDSLSSLSFARLSRLTNGGRNMPICTSTTTSNNPSESSAQQRRNHGLGSIKNRFIHTTTRHIRLLLAEEEDPPPPQKILPPNMREKFSTPTPFSSRTSATWLKNEKGEKVD